MEYLIQNPATSYGIEFVRRMHRRFGARAVAFYTRRGGQPLDRRLYPELFSREHVAASYLVAPDADTLTDFAAHLRRHHRIEVAVPYCETTLLGTMAVAEALGLEGLPIEAMRRFRDKAALKSHLRAVDPGLRINHAELVASPDEAWAVVRRHRLPRFVLKPNDGYGNINIGIFNADDPPALLQAYWQQAGAAKVLLEEYIGGRQFHCNGQVDAAGGILITDVGETLYAENERRNVVTSRSHQTPCRAPEFAVIADYTRRMIAASGLRRCPFHAELRLDEAGPTLLECAARVIGSDWPKHSALLHGPRFDMFDLAAHYYGSAAPYGDPGIDWAFYDTGVLARIKGVSDRSERIRHLEGVAEVERLPAYVDWFVKPHLGQRLACTSDLLTLSYSLTVRGRSLADVDAIDRQVRGLLRWNHRPPSLADRVSVWARRAAGYGSLQLRHRRQRRLGLFARRFGDPEAASGAA